MSAPGDIRGGVAEPAAAPPRGAAPVGLIDELPPAEAAAILYFRLWCDGPSGRARIHADLCSRLGPAEADLAAGVFDALMATVLSGMRRPLMRHGTECRCFGGDESAFANMVAAALSDEIEDAMIFAAALMRGAPALDAAVLAGRLRPAFPRAPGWQTDAGPAAAAPFTRH